MYLNTSFGEQMYAFLRQIALSLALVDAIKQFSKTGYTHLYATILTSELRLLHVFHVLDLLHEY